MFYRVPLYLIGCFLFFSFLSSCAHISVPAQPSQRPCSSLAILAALEQAESPLVVKGVAKIKVITPNEKFSVKELVVVHKPHSLRLETLSPLGRPQFFVVTDGEELFVFSPSEKKFFQGAISPASKLPFISLNLSIEEVVSLFLGSITLINYDAEHVDCREEGDYYLLRMSTVDGSTGQTLKVNSDNYTVAASEIYHNGEGLYRAVQFENYEMIGEVLFPKKITIFMPRDGTTVTIRYKKLEFPAEIDSAEFRLNAPEGAEVIYLK